VTYVSVANTFGLLDEKLLMSSTNSSMILYFSEGHRALIKAEWLNKRHMQYLENNDITKFVLKGFI
jgi:hypothetical protein